MKWKTLKSNRFMIGNKNVKVYVYVFFLLLIFLGLAFLFAWTEATFWSEVFASLAGAVVVAIITLFLLQGQARSESEKEQHTMIFQKKLEVYQAFLSTLNTIAANQKISDEDKMNLQFQIAYIAIHTESARLKAISEQVVSIIRKLEVDDSIDNSVYNELCQISVEFHNELYDNKWTSIDFDLQVAIGNFSCLKISKGKEMLYRRLLWIEDCVSLYPLETQIIESTNLIIKINILPEVIGYWQLSSASLYIWLRPDDKDEIRTGKVYMYIENDTKQELPKILEFVKKAKRSELEEKIKQKEEEGTEKAFKAIKFIHKLLDKESDYEKDPIFLGTSAKQVVKYVGFDRKQNPNADVLCVYDLIGYLSPIWVEKECVIVRRDVSSSKGNGLQLFTYKPCVNLNNSHEISSIKQ